MWKTFLSRDNGSSDPTNISASSVKCTSDYQIYQTVWAATEIISATVGFLACAAIIWETVQKYRRSGQRDQGRSSSSSTSSDLLMVNLILTGIINNTTLLLHAFNSLSSVSHLSPQLIAALSAVTLIAGPPSMVSICLDCYLAVVHPLRYRHLKKTWRHPLILTAFIWLYTVIAEAIIIVRQLPPYNYICIMTFYVAFPAIIFLNVSTLQALWLTGPERQRLADLCPIKRRAFLVVLSILLCSVIYSLPQIILLTYWALIKMEQESFLCVVVPMVMMFPTITSAVVCLVFVYFKTSMKLCVIKH